MITPQKLTGLELALWGRKKQYFATSSERHWLDHNSQIRLSLKQRTSHNAEFYVNGDTSHTIWYSQLSEILLTIDSLSLTSGEIIAKNGDDKFVFEFDDIDQFIEYVKGKTFRVSVNTDGKVAGFDFETLPMDEYEDAQRLIKGLTERGDYQKAASYLLPNKRRYLLTEV